MIISYNWLKEYINTDLSAEQVSEILTDIGLEVEKVEEIESIKGGLEGLVIGEVLTKEKHPDADRLSVTTVKVNNDTIQQIVCGAPNVDAGQKVVVALPGTTIHPLEGDAFKIKKSKIRGVESLGMICAEDEIGLGNDHDGILVLPSDAPVGTSAKKWFNVSNDIIFEIGLTPNRADAMSHIGVARDLMAALKFRNLIDQSSEISWPSVENFNPTNVLDVKISVEKNEACERYAGLTIEGVKVQESPKWLKEKLNSIGLTPINNIVDVTNFVLHEVGQPLHAFDKAVVGKNINVKTLSNETSFETLDNEKRELSDHDLMICNENEGMCIAGVFGGSKSGVSEATTSIFLESAYFNPVWVRKTAKRHGLSTDASFRFERGIDPNITIYALKRAALLIQELAGGEISSFEDIYPNKIENFVLNVSVNRIKQLCGVDFKSKEIITILNLLEIEVLENNTDNLKISVPPYRVDVQREADIAEEVLRIYGFNNIPLPEKLNTSLSHRPEIDAEYIQNTVSNLLASLGISEAMSNSLTKGSYNELADSIKVKDEFTISMLNPLSSDLNVLRQTLIFNALEAVSLNQKHSRENIKVFEFGKTYQKFESGYEENKRLLIALNGNHHEEIWNEQKSDITFFTIKGIFESLLTKLGLRKQAQVIATKNDLLEDGITYKILKKKVADIGWVRSDITAHFDIKREVFIADIDWDAILELTKINQIKFKPLAKYPAVKRDLSLLIDNNIQFGEIEQLSKNIDKKLLKEVTLFDVYKGKNIPEGKKSYAVRFTLQDVNKTLKDKDIDKVMSKIQASLTGNLNAQIR